MGMETPLRPEPLPETPIIETERLILRPLGLGDAPAIQSRVSKWDVAKYLSSAPWPYPADGAETFLREVALPAVEAGTEMIWAIIVKPEAGLAGVVAPDTAVGVLSFIPDPAAIDNRGFWLDLELHGHGLMTEAVVAFQDYVFLELGHDRLKMSNAQSNAGSRRVKQKTGARFVRLGQMDFSNGETVCEHWEITREDWISFRTPLH